MAEYRGEVQYTGLAAKPGGGALQEQKSSTPAPTSQTSLSSCEAFVATHADFRANEIKLLYIGLLHSTGNPANIPSTVDIALSTPIPSILETAHFMVSTCELPLKHAPCGPRQASPYHQKPQQPRRAQ